MSLFEIRCPMCKGTIWIDPSTGKVLDHKSTDHQKADLSAFLKTHKQRGSELDDQFKKSKEQQEKRKQELEQRFKQAKEHPEDLTGEVENPFLWD